MADRGKVFRKIDGAFPSSQICSHCGSVDGRLPDDRIRVWECPVCHKIHDCDINAAVNALREGIWMLTA